MIRRINPFIIFIHYLILLLLITNILLRFLNNLSINVSHSYLIYSYLITGLFLLLGNSKIFRIIYFSTILPLLILNLTFETYFQNNQYLISYELNGVTLFEKKGFFQYKIGKLAYDDCAIDLHKSINKIEIKDNKTLILDNAVIMEIRN